LLSGTFMANRQKEWEGLPGRQTYTPWLRVWAMCHAMCQHQSQTNGSQGSCRAKAEETLDVCVGLQLHAARAVLFKPSDAKLSSKA